LGPLPSDLIGKLEFIWPQEKGAFKAPISQRIGRFEAADKGTLFLDEIG